MERLLTVKDVADILRVKEGTIYNWNSLGKLKPIKFCGSPRYLQEDIEKLIEKGKRG